MSEQYEERVGSNSPAPAASEHNLDESERLIRLEEVVRFVRRHALLLAICTLIPCAATLFYLKLVQQPVYQATATLLRTPSQIRSDLSPAPLSIQGYEQLLRSASVVSDTIDRLKQSELLASGQTLRMGRQMDSRIFLSRRSDEAVLAPMIEVIGRSTDPELAAHIANHWSASFLEHTEGLNTDSIEPVVQIIAGQYAKARQELVRAEALVDETANDFETRIHEELARWEQRFLDFSKRTEDLIVEHQTESQQAISGVLDRALLLLSRTESTPSLSVLRLTRQIQRVGWLRTQLAQTPEVVSLEVAPSSDVLWQALLAGEYAPSQLTGFFPTRLHTDQVNPAYIALTEELAELELDLTPLHPDRQAELRALLSEMERVQRTRSAGLRKLGAEHVQKLTAIDRQKDEALERLRRERETMVSRLQRDAAIQRESFHELAKRFEETEVARAAQDVRDIELASTATTPRDPVQVHSALKALLAACVGLGLGIVVAIVLEVG